jgi:hypothetical protein
MPDYLVRRGLDPRIACRPEDDGRIKSGHDAEGVVMLG